VLIGAARDVPAVRDGKIIATRQVTLTVTIDHRFIDGFQAGTLAAEFRSVFADPWQLDDQVGEIAKEPA
jgi:pyruvate/2-oxoglutarate dehydrogenase complex dihydrolipoamide acyltransferase (E2) component